MKALEATAKILLDKKRVMARVEAGENRVLYRVGGYARRVMRSQFRRATKKGKPRPGRPPRSRTGLLKTHTVFAVDKKRHNVDIGVAKVKFWDDSSLIRKASVPQLLDEGGKKRVDGKQVRYRAFPFKKPAREKAVDKLADELEKRGLT